MRVMFREMSRFVFGHYERYSVCKQIAQKAGCLTVMTTHTVISLHDDRMTSACNRSWPLGRLYALWGCRDILRKRRHIRASIVC